MSEVMEKPEVKAEKAKPARKYKITIHSGEDKGDKGDVFLSHNYKTLLIQRDKEVVIDERYLNVLKGTMIETFVKDPETGKESAVRIPRFSYNVEPV